ncbi:MAG: ABC transporter substrate-binding protein [Hyphomicrobiales bacterium]|nr:ABC transporter substrate-binding protein [Hyphomicrobiales bacterium]
MTTIRRRTLLRGASAAAVAGGLGLPSIARAAEPLVINSYGGPFEKFMREEIIPVFEKETGIKTKLDIGLAKDWLATLRAAGVDNPPYDVLLMNGIFAALLRAEGFFEPIPVAEVPNLKDLVPVARMPNDNGVIAWIQPLGVAYRSDMTKAQPAAWKDLWNPEFKGHIGLYTITNTGGMMFLLMIAKIFGGSEYKTDVAFDEIRKLRPFTQVDFSGTMEIMLTRGEVTVVPLDFPAVARLKLKGAEIDIKPPAEGSFMFDQMFDMLRGSKKKAEGYKWINFLLRPDIQEKWVNGFYVTPSNQGAKIPDNLKPLIPLYGDRTKEIVVFDWDTANKNRDAIIDRWNKEMT